MKKLKRKIEKVENEHNCSLNFESVTKLILKVQEEYGSGTQKLGFKNLVERCAEGLELHYNYCRVAFSYPSGNKKEKIQKNRSTEHLQNTFSLENKIIKQAEITL